MVRAVSILFLLKRWLKFNTSASICLYDSLVITRFFFILRGNLFKKRKKRKKYDALGPAHSQYAQRKC